MNKVLREIPAKGKVINFRRALIKWHKKNERSYSWRKTRDPFKVLIAEMMLQRTKADQVQPVYLNFFSHFATPFEVAKANMNNLNRILYPLGLRWRIKKFKEVAQSIVKDFNGKVPDVRNEILKLPGVGDYVAGIVLSIAYNKSEWIVDSNVVRVFKRYFGISTSKEGRRDKHVIGIAKIYADCKNPRKANLALLDFAALICTPKKPKHHQCSLSGSCHYFLHHGIISDNNQTL